MIITIYLSYTVISFNVNGLNDGIKRPKVVEWIKWQEPYICCLQETSFRWKDTNRLKAIQALDNRQQSIILERKKTNGVSLHSLWPVGTFPIAVWGGRVLAENSVSQAENNRLPDWGARDWTWLLLKWLEIFAVVIILGKLL